MSAPTLTDVERIWTRARDLYRHGRGARVPRADNTALLLALLDGPGCGSEIARRAGVNQGNATAHQLPRLCAMRLVDGWEMPPSAQGGRRAWTWALTPTGRELAEALRAGREADAAVTTWAVGDEHECPLSGRPHAADQRCVEYALETGDRLFVDTPQTPRPATAGNGS